MESTSFFFSDVANESLKSAIITRLEGYALANFQQIYIINKPLSEKKYSYMQNKIILFLSPGYNMYFVNLNLQESEFTNLYEDFIEDLGHIADKYNYTEVIQRPRVWKEFIKKISFSDFSSYINDEEKLTNFMKNNKLELEANKRSVKLLISLLTGSINSIEKIGRDLPESVLAKVKGNIILFDGDQTRFIFEDKYKDKIIKIQGLAGTGKTELLLHRLKEIYISNKTNRIIFTCQSKTLANRLKARITEFFNFMKVEEQIDWNERLWTMHGWGSTKDTYNLGTYGMICRRNNLPFYTPREGSFAYACKKTLEYIKMNNIELPLMCDYMLIDEGQDFTDEFIELCSLVTKQQVFVAGDIFQDIFGVQSVEAKPHYLLNKCYRTDPRTLMFSHALGLALYEKPPLRFLKDKEWKACGYNFEIENGVYNLTREPVKRFEDIKFLEISESIKIKTYKEYNSNDIIDVIKDIMAKYPDVKPEDIAIVFPNQSLTYSKFDRLEYALYEELKVKANILHNTKEIKVGEIAISNKNNIKGLEFPFIICVVDYVITRNLQLRNTLYMALTRSFIGSYLIVQEEKNEDLISTLNEALSEINTSLIMNINEPSLEARQKQEAIIREYNENGMLNQYELITEIFKELNIDMLNSEEIRKTVANFRPNEMDKDKLKDFIIMLKGI